MRSLLFAPGDSPRKIEKALESSADAVILDLEDSVSAVAKAEARGLVVTTLRGRGERRVGVRVNAADTPWHLADLAAVCSCAPDFVMLPKSSGADDVRLLDAKLCALETVSDVAPGAIAILPLATETAGALLSLDYKSLPRVTALCFAAEDLSADLGIVARRNGALNPLLEDARRRVAISAAACGLPCIDTPFPDPRDESGLEREIVDAVVLGFTGKLCIHPAQVGSVNRAFSPGADELAWAAAVVDAIGGDDAPGVAVVAGKMVDKAHLRLAKRRLAAAAGQWSGARR